MNRAKREFPRFRRRSLLAENHYRQRRRPNAHERRCFARAIDFCHGHLPFRVCARDAAVTELVRGEAESAGGLPRMDSSCTRNPNHVLSAGACGCGADADPTGIRAPPVCQQAAGRGRAALPERRRLPGDNELLAANTPHYGILQGGDPQGRQEAAGNVYAGIHGGPQLSGMRCMGHV